ncbi:type VI secretion system baseplate subunit TssF [Helicobacter didelphidarum]|uniref:Type VI secretion system baseplate subunit TssF n=1 Tax=Helicobacter didelphidarum TaxID=2040648 RepID=A0A3D8IDA6_9HELI|nr:type VI secretion system baseplate subunit TssF [Helicobacter didelphidarum]RDU62926.1 type VI secretion system baseplate subunit TssF [Helicobacter didelphidarum]
MQDNIYYYKKELDYLHKMRTLFVRNFPKLAPFLDYNSKDPDIERLIENFAILTSKLHQELDSNIPLLAESLINIISPNYTNPLPSVCIQDFTLSPDAKALKLFLPKNTEVHSIPIDDVECRFKTLYDVWLYPLQITDCTISNAHDTHSLSLDLMTSKSDIAIASLDISHLDIYLGNDIYTSNTLLMWILHYLKEIIIFFENGEEFRIQPSFVTHRGLGEGESAFNSGENGFEAFALLQELFFIPEKFNFIRINKLDILKRCNARGFRMKFNFTKPLPAVCIPRAEMLSLSASPIVNAFPISAEPIINKHDRESYRIFINQNKPQGYEIVEVVRVKAHNSDTGKRILKNYKSFERFGIFENNRLNDFYSLSYKKDAYQTPHRHISFFSQTNITETISIETIACNKHLPSHLKIGHINKLNSKDIITRNITLPTPMKQVEIDGELLWKIVSVISFNYQSLLDKPTFLTALESYSFHLHNDTDNIVKRFAKALVEIHSKPIYRLSNMITKKGTLCIMSIDESRFYCLGEVYKMGLVFAKFFSHFASINSFCELQIRSINKDTITTINYPYKDGSRAIM